ncbi:hypothetical protein GDO78_016504, partial [Eleutherodactylus coqui]
LSQILTLVVEELGLFYHRDINGIGLLYSLLQAPWLQSLLKVADVLRESPSSSDSRELRHLLRGPHFKALLSAHDTVAQKDFEPVLPPLPENIPENEEAMRIVCLVKNKQPLVHSEGTIIFKLIPIGDRTVSSHTMLFVRAMADYWPQQDAAIPCADAGLPFKRGEILQIVDQSDSMWWQARKASDSSRCAGLIPSNHLLKRKQREFWWSQPFMSHSCLKASQSGFRRSMRLCRRKSHSIQFSCYSRCPSSCYHTLAAPYEEVVRYQRRPCDRHRLIVLVGPSGVGVNELRKQFIRLNPSMFHSPVPHTTRHKKSYEENGREYFFVSKETFESMVYSHSFLEYGEYKGHMYGTSTDTVKEVLDAGKICIIDLEPQGIMGARTHELKPYVIFIKPPSRTCMRQTRRNASILTDYYVNLKYKEEDFQEIEESAAKMEEQFSQFFNQVLVNDDLHSASVQLLSIVRRAQDEPQWIPAAWICSDS